MGKQELLWLGLALLLLVVLALTGGLSWLLTALLSGW